VVEVGGLHILGTERHEARRIDRQLRGRSGRQGDPGSSRFSLSLEDDLMRLFGSERIAGIMDRLGVQEGEVITHPMITNSIGRAQKRVETQNFGIRKHLLEYDDVMNRQREVIYERRNRVLLGKDVEQLVLEIMDEWIEATFDRTTEDKGSVDSWNLEELQRNLAATLRVYLDISVEALPTLHRQDLLDKVKELGRAALEKRKAEIDPALFTHFLNGVILGNIDEEWKDHLYEMDRLKEGVGLRAYGQRDPLVEFKKEGFGLFEEMLDRINQKSLRTIFQAKILTAPRVSPRVAPEQMAQIHRQAAGMAYAAVQAPASERTSAPAGAATSSEKPKPVPIKKGKMPGRNDPCPCGSGKKFKHCHGA